MKRSATSLAVALLLGMQALSVQAQAPAPAEADMDIPEFLSTFTERQQRTKAMQRFLHNYRMRANPDGTLPDSPGSRVVPQLNALAAQSALPYVVNSRWVALGPTPITGGQIGNALTTRPMSGRVSALAVHPTNPNRWLVGTAAGGVWETRDGGVNFVAITDNAPTLAVGAVAYAPSEPNTIYVGTGEATFSGVSFGGEGVLKSTDGGVNWKQMATGTFVKGTAFGALKVDPNNANVLVAATTLGVFGRPSSRPPTIGARGLWRSTDGGVNWTRTLSLDGISIAARPDNFNAQYAGTGFGVPTAGGVQRSTDGGQTWAAVTGPWSSIGGTTDRTEVVIAPSNPNRVYVAMSNSTTAGMHGLWTTANAWDANPTWVQISLAPTDDGTGTLGPCGFDKAFNSASQQCWYNMTLTVKPTDENMLFFGGIPVWRYDGTNWVEVSQTAAPANRNNGVHVDQHASAWAGNRLIIGNDGGVWSTTSDGNDPWTTHNNTLNTVQYYEGSVSPDGSYMLGGSQDNGTHRRSGSNAWPLIWGGDGAGNLASSNTNFAVSSQNQNVVRTTNGGVSFTNVRSGYGGVAPFIGKMRECPTAPGTVILNGSRINRATNFYGAAVGSVWTNGGFIFSDGRAGTSIAFGNNCNVIASGNALGEIRITDVGNITQAGMIERDPGNQVPNRGISSIAFDPNSNTRVCVGLTGFSGGAAANLFCTADFTAATPTWVNASIPVDMPVNAVLFDRSVPNRLYAGGDFGIWVSNNGGSTWNVWGAAAGLPNVAVFDLVQNASGLYAFTHGRGAFKLANFDITGDSAVTCADVNVVKSSFGKRVGDAGFNPTADLNADNIINIRDLTMLTRQLPAGTSCS